MKQERKKNLLNFIFAKTRCEPKRDLNFEKNKISRSRASEAHARKGNSEAQRKLNVLFSFVLDPVFVSSCVTAVSIDFVKLANCLFQKVSVVGAMHVCLLDS